MPACRPHVARETAIVRSDTGAQHVHANSATVHKMCPLSIYYICFKKQILWIIPLTFTVLGIFGLNGAKNILLMPFFILLTYFGLKNKKLIFFYLYSLISVNLFGIFESLVFKTNLILDFIIRRALFVPGVTSSFYLDHMSSIESKGNLSFEIGEYYFNNLEMNTNTNFLVLSFVKNGLLGPLFISFLAGIILSIIKKSPGKDFPFLGELICCNVFFIWSEQALHTSMLSGGVFWSIILSVFLSNIKKNKKYY